MGNTWQIADTVAVLHTKGKGRKFDCLAAYEIYKNTIKEPTIILNSQYNSSTNPIYEEIVVREEPS